MTGTPPAAAAALRRSLLRAARDPRDDQGLADCAELLRAAGQAAPARMLYEVVFLARGFSPYQRGRQAGLAAATGLWPVPAGDPPAGPSSAIEAARADLERMLDIAPRSRPAGTAPSSPPPAEGDLPALVGLMCGLLRQPGEDALFAALEAMLERLRGAVVDRAPPALFEAADGAILVLATRLAAQALRAFLIDTADLCRPPLGSPALFHAAARAGSAGLGPYLTNVDRLVRRARDMPALVLLAGGSRQGTPARDRIERGCALLARALPHHRLRELIDELADLGLTGAIRHILAALATRVDQPREILWAIRDGALDNGDLPLAIEAQARVAARHEDAIEWIVLGEIEATAGNSAAAERALREGLKHDPGHLGGQERLAAVRGGSFDRFRVAGGFGTAPHRRLLRTARQHERRGPDRSLMADG